MNCFCDWKSSTQPVCLAILPPSKRVWWIPQGGRGNGPSGSRIQKRINSYLFWKKRTCFSLSNYSGTIVAFWFVKTASCNVLGSFFFIFLLYLSSLRCLCCGFSGGKWKCVTWFSRALFFRAVPNQVVTWGNWIGWVR